MVKIFTIAFLLLGLSAPHSLQAADIRFYKINKHQQSDRLWVSKKKSTRSGCNNFRGAPRIFKVVQIGYQSCSIYSAKNCSEESLIRARHNGIDAYAKNLSEGFGWQPSTDTALSKQSNDSRGVKLRSWNCHIKQS